MFSLDCFNICGIRNCNLYTDVVTKKETFLGGYGAGAIPPTKYHAILFVDFKYCGLDRFLSTYRLSTHDGSPVGTDLYSDVPVEEKFTDNLVELLSRHNMNVGSLPQYNEFYLILNGNGDRGPFPEKPYSHEPRKYYNSRHYRSNGNSFLRTFADD